DAPAHEVHAEVAPLDGETGLEPRPVSAARVFPRADLLELDRDGAGDPVEGEVPRDLVGLRPGQLDLLALEGDGRELPGVEEVRPLEVLVALGVVGIDALGLGPDFQGAGGGVLLVEGDAAGDVVEPPVAVADPEVLHPEEYRRVGAV